EVRVNLGFVNLDGRQPYGRQFRCFGQCRAACTDRRVHYSSHGSPPVWKGFRKQFHFPTWGLLFQMFERKRTLSAALRAATAKLRSSARRKKEDDGRRPA